jgi:hypothetical protein
MTPQELTITFDLNTLNLTQLAALASVVPTTDHKTALVIERAMYALEGKPAAWGELDRVNAFINGQDEAVRS